MANPKIREINKINREKRQKLIPPGMFIISAGMTTKESLSNLEKSLNDKGIKTQVIEDLRGYFYLCREGKESIGSPYY